MMRTTPAAAPVATPAMVPFACCFWGVMVGCELSGAIVELGIRLVDVDEVLCDDVWVVKGMGRVASVVGRCGSCDSVGREVGCEVGRDTSDDVGSVGRCDVGRGCSSC